MPAIWRVAAAISADAVVQEDRVQRFYCRFPSDRLQASSYALRAEAGSVGFVALRAETDGVRFVGLQAGAERDLSVCRQKQAVCGASPSGQKRTVCGSSVCRQEQNAICRSAGRNGRFVVLRGEMPHINRAFDSAQRA